MKANEKQIPMGLEEIYWDLIKQQIEPAASQIKLKNMKETLKIISMLWASEKCY